MNGPGGSGTKVVPPEKASEEMENMIVDTLAEEAEITKRKESELKSREKYKEDLRISAHLNMGNLANAGMTGDDSKTATRLLGKNWSPLIVRKYQLKGWPLFVGVICDANLNELDNIVYTAVDKSKDLGFMNGNIQDVRNFCGFLSDELVNYYDNIKRGCVEGIAVLWYVDKCFVSSLYGDFMVHASCKIELFQIINTLPHI